MNKAVQRGHQVIVAGLGADVVGQRSSKNEQTTTRKAVHVSCHVGGLRTRGVAAAHETVQD